MPNFIDISNNRYNRLLVLHKVGAKNNKIYWLCVCDCGNTKTVSGSNIKSGQIKSCGCLKIETGRLPKTRTHGMKGTKVYNVWWALKGRCYNKRNVDYKHYGGRGITVCDRWLESFENFYEDMGNKPDGLSIDRINNNGPYSKDNCRWATPSQQQNNKRNNTKLQKEI